MTKYRMPHDEDNFFYYVWMGLVDEFKNRWALLLLIIIVTSLVFGGTKGGRLHHWFCHDSHCQETKK